MKEEWKLIIKRAIVWKKAQSYTEHGCNITGNLIIAWCTAAFKAHPRSGEYNAGCSYDVQDMAKEVLKERGVEGYHIRLSMPDLVVAVDVDTWDKFSTSGEAPKCVRQKHNSP